MILVFAESVTHAIAAACGLESTRAVEPYIECGSDIQYGEIPPSTA